MDVRATLRLIPALAALPEGEMSRFASVAFRRHMRRREPLFLEGEGPAGFFMIESGWLKMTRSSGTGKEVLLDVLGPGETIGSCCGTLAGPQTCSALALTPARIVWVRGPTWQSLIRESPRVASAMMEHALSVRRRCVDLAVRLAVQDVEGRLAGLLLRLAGLNGSAETAGEVSHLLSQQEMAEAIGTAREVVTRHLAKLVDRGVLKRNGRRILIANPEELKSLSQGA